MLDINKLLTGVISGDIDGRRLPADRPEAPGSTLGEIGKVLGGNIGALGTGALAGGLAGTLLSSKHTRKLAGSALKLGAAALVGGLAYKAYSDYRAGRPVLSEGLASLFGGDSAGKTGVDSAQDALPALAARDATLVLRAMIAAAMADGRLDDAERARIIAKIEASGLSGEEKQHLEALIANPDSPAQLATAATGPEAAAEIYLAAYLAIDADTPSERNWLNDLSAELKLPEPLRKTIEATVHATVDRPTT
jgi:uncharacterized membrane protein YebE (DUF533 family)